MKYTIETSFENFKPWSGAVTTFRRIIDAGKAEEAERYLEDIAPGQGWTDVGINDYLWFEADDIFRALGIDEDDETTEG